MLFDIVRLVFSVCHLLSIYLLYVTCYLNLILILSLFQNHKKYKLIYKGHLQIYYGAFSSTTIFVNLGSRIGSKNNSVLSRIPSLNNRQHNNYYMKFKGKYVKDRKDYCIKNDYYN